MSGAGPVLSALAALVYVTILAPIVVVVIIAFSADSFIAFPPSGYSFRWFAQLTSNDKLMGALAVSARIAGMVTVLTLALAVPAALALSKSQFRGKDALATVLMAPLLLPTLIIGLALLLAFAPWRLTSSVTGLMLGHMVVTVPFAVRLLSTALSNLPGDVEAAAATLGASPWRVMAFVTLPLAAPGLIASAALSFLLSFDETVISLFISGPRVATLPVEMVHYIEGRTDPLVAALSVLLIVATFAVVLVVERLIGVRRAVGR